MLGAIDRLDIGPVEARPLLDLLAAAAQSRMPHTPAGVGAAAPSG
jgi:hypothetical protein